MHPPRDLDLLDPRLKPLCDAILAQSRIVGASVAVVADDVAYHYAYGSKSVETGEPVTADTSFNIGSCSKAFASATFAALVGEGLAAWDDTVSNWIPEFQLADPAVSAMVTFRDCSGNRLGLPQLGYTESGLDPAFPAEHILERMRHVPFAFPFRSRFGYVNSGHTVTALAAGKITGKGFLPTLKERILAPLGMTGTSGGASTPIDLADRAGWHLVRDGTVHLVDEVCTDQYLGAGGMSVSGRDAGQWMRLHLNRGLVDGRQVIAADALAETHHPQAVATPGKDLVSLFYPYASMAAYCLGWAMSDLEGHPMVSHAGGDVGIMANTMLFPRSGLGISVYTNTTGVGGAAVTLTYAIAGTLLGLAPRDWDSHLMKALAGAGMGIGGGHAPVAEPPALPSDLSVFIGSYANLTDGPLDIWAEGEGLAGSLRHGYRADFTLAPIGPEAFEIHFNAIESRPGFGMPPPQLIFTLEQGRAVSAELPGFFSGRPFARKDTPPFAEGPAA